MANSKAINSKQVLTLLLSALFSIAAILAAQYVSVPAQAAERPFPDYDLEFEWIHGEVDPNWKPGDPGDGCLRSANPEITHLYTYGFGSKIHPCDGVRTTMTFNYNEVNPAMPPTLQFRLGVTWQYTKRSDNNPYIWKPVENFMMDGQLVDPAKYDTLNQEDVVVKRPDGTWQHLGNNNPRDFFEPVHVVFDDEFYNDEVHTFRWDAYLPADGDFAGMTIGTGSTGDTEGGSIGVKANGLKVGISAYADYRYVLDSEYRAARNIADPTVKIKNRPLAYWGGELAGSTYTTIQCLEQPNQHLAPVMREQNITEIYPELVGVVANPGNTEFESSSGDFALAYYPYEFFVGQVGNWADLTGLKLMNWDKATETFYSHGDKNIPYKPTLESVKREIPGYTYVDNDIPIDPEGKLEMPGYRKTAAPNFELSYHKTMGVDTQHMYFTYKPNPGSFELTKTDATGAPLPGARFELYQLVEDVATPCGVAPDLTDTVQLEVCEVRTPANTDELRDMLASAPTQCAPKTLRKVVLDGFATDGTFTTGDDGKFTPQGEPALLPGNYFVREVAAPAGYEILNEFLPLEVPVQAAKDKSGQLVSAAVPGKVVVNNFQTPPPPDEPEDPNEPDLPPTGMTPVWPAAIVLLGLGTAVLLLKRKYSK
ncbi:MAG: prealbumin-like fold domain-containing protein [Trueperella sp.]|nr:prealbumin-like fold domain-containing protein [Trueperella sp.]